MAAPPQSFGSPANRRVNLDPSVFYHCQRCTHCCRWPGDVRLDEEEIARIARFLELSEGEFIGRFTRLRSDRQGLSLMEKDNDECVMLDGNDCRIHEVKPAQCAGFPNRWNFPGWREVCEAVPMTGFSLISSTVSNPPQTKPEPAGTHSGFSPAAA